MKPTSSEVPKFPKKLKLYLDGTIREHLAPEDVHLAWRYGVTVEPKNEKEILDWLKKVDQFIMGRIKKR